MTRVCRCQRWPPLWRGEKVRISGGGRSPALCRVHEPVCGQIVVQLREIKEKIGLLIIPVCKIIFLLHCILGYRGVNVIGQIRCGVAFSSHSFFARPLRLLLPSPDHSVSFFFHRPTTLTPSSSIARPLRLLLPSADRSDSLRHQFRHTEARVYTLYRRFTCFRRC